MENRAVRSSYLERMEEQREDLDERVIDIARVAKVVKGGRRFSFRVTAVVGGNRGPAGGGRGKARGGWSARHPDQVARKREHPERRSGDHGRLAHSAAAGGAGGSARQRGDERVAFLGAKEEWLSARSRRESASRLFAAPSGTRCGRSAPSARWDCGACTKA